MPDIKLFLAACASAVLLDSSRPATANLGALLPSGSIFRVFTRLERKVI